MMRPLSAESAPSALPAHLPPTRAGLAVLTELASLLGGHVPVDRALALVAAQQRDRRARREVLDLAVAVRHGRQLSEALAAKASFFGSMAAAVARAGESAGALPELLGQLVAHLRRQSELRRKLAAALAYPAVVSLVALGAIALLLTLVVPRMQVLFDSLAQGGAVLPLPTRLLIAAGSFAQSPPGLLLCVLLAGVPLSVLVFPKLRSDLAPLFSRLPLLGPVIRNGALARALGTLSLLLRAGLPLPEALSLSGAASGNAQLQQAFETLRAQVLRGAPLSNALRNVPKIVPPTAAEVAAVGEETGCLPEQLDWLAFELGQRATARAGILLTLVEPALVLLMALVVGLAVAALFLPIVSIIENLGQ